MESEQMKAFQMEQLAEQIVRHWLETAELHRSLEFLTKSHDFKSFSKEQMKRIELILLDKIKKSVEAR